jgi:hypothetical protein
LPTVLIALIRRQSAPTFTGPGAAKLVCESDKSRKAPKNAAGFIKRGFKEAPTFNYFFLVYPFGHNGFKPETFLVTLPFTQAIITLVAGAVVK